MSSSKLKQATRYVVDRANQKKKTKKAQKDSQARSDAEKEYGQMLVINKEHQAALIFRAFGIRLSLKERKELFSRLDIFLKSKEARLRMSKEDKEAAISLKPKFKKKQGDMVYVISNFEASKRLKFKSRNPDDASKIQANYLNSLKRNARDITDKEVSSLSQMGHGDRGVSASQFGVDRAISEAKDKFNLSDSEMTQLVAITLKQRVKHAMKINFNHSQIFSSEGKFNKSFRFVISSQDGLQNKADRDIETAVFMETLKEMEILGLETSTLVPDAIAQVTLYNLAGKKHKNKKVTGKRKRVIKEKASGSMTNKVEASRVVTYAAQRGLSTKGVKRRKSTSKNKSSASHPLKLLGILNQKLPETVKKNMNSPALVNQTGRFADSVKVVDINQTPKGFPSVGYTYQRNPYEVFEDGNGSAPWANGNRDPRQLIDKSIREIAVQFAIGRFYTRRL
jgi:hypothetical protein